MRDSSDLYHSGRVAEWAAVLQRDGYLLLRGVLPPQKILAARSCVCEALRDDWDRIDTESQLAQADAVAAAAGSPTEQLFSATPLLRARIKLEPASAASSSSSSASVPARLQPGVLMTGYRPVTHDPRVLDVLEGPELSRMFAQLFGHIRAEERATSAAVTPAATPLVAPATFDTKWVRVHSRSELTDEHTDYYRFEHFDAVTTGKEDGAKDMFTCWIPLGFTPISHGTLAVAESTHKLRGYSKGVFDPTSSSSSSEEGKSREELPPDFRRWLNGTLPDSPGPAVWRTTAFAPGDLVVFDIRLVHASTRNDHDCFRMSMDTRWKPNDQVGPDQRESFNDMSAHLPNRM